MSQCFFGSNKEVCSFKLPHKPAASSQCKHHFNSRRARNELQSVSLSSFSFSEWPHTAVGIRKQMGCLSQFLTIFRKWILKVKLDFVMFY